MGREATKAIGNPWYEARMEAAKWDDRLLSREGAAELLGMSVSAVADAELNLTKCMPPDKAVQMADLYKAPHLLKVIPSSLGGDTSGVQVPFQVHNNGNRHKVNFDLATKKATKITQ